MRDTLRKQISSVLYRATSFEDFSDRLMQQYGITVKESRGQLSYLPSGRTKFIRAKHLGDKFDKAAVLSTLQANTERKPKAQFKQDTIGKLIDIQSRMTEGKGIGYKRWLTKHNLKVMAQTVKLLQEKGLTDEDALNQRIAELETKYHDALAVVKDLEGRMKANKELRYHVAAYTSTKSVAQQLKTAKRPALFEEQHRAELTAYRVAGAYFKASNITKLPSPKNLEAEYPELKVEPTPDADGVIRIPGKAPVMPFRKFESVYDSDAYPEDVRYEYVALEELTTRFRISFNYQLEQMPDNAQRDVILEIIHKHKDYLTSLEAALADVKDQTA